MEQHPVPRGTLRVHLGAAPGVGTTHALLVEGRRRAARGADVVIGHLEHRDRPETAALAAELEAVAAAPPPGHRAELDVTALLARGPQVVLVDELAHQGPAPEGRPRWREVEELLAAGIDVVATLDVGEVESQSDLAARLTGRPAPATVPDAWLRAHAQVELVDMTPEALRRRLAHGNVYPAEAIDVITDSLFELDTLAALRQLALRWVADQARSRHGAPAPETVLVAVTAAPGNPAVVRRAARLAAGLDGDLIGVHVAPQRLTGGPEPVDPGVEVGRRLITDLGGTYLDVAGDDVADALVSVARAQRATQIVIGASRRTRLQDLVRGSIVNDLVRQARDLDVHVIAGDGPAGGSGGRAPAPHRRRTRGWLTLAVGLPLLVAVMVPWREELGVPASLLLLLSLTVVVAAVGGIVPGVVAAVTAVLAANYFLVPPYRALTVDATQDTVALAVFVIMGVVVATSVERVRRRSTELERARADTAALARSATALASERDPLPTILAEVRAALHLDAAGLERVGDDGARITLARAGLASPPPGAHEMRRTVDEDRGIVLVLHGGQIDGAGHELLDALTDDLAVAVGSAELQRAAERAELLARVDSVRSGILQAVSHDLRTPLAGIKASVTSLLADDVEIEAGDERIFLETIDAEVERLDRVVGNLLDMSRLQSGTLGVSIHPTALEDVVSAALDDAGATGHRAVVVDVPETLPLVAVDPGLVERALANVVANALVVQPAGTPVTVRADQVGPSVVLQVVDRGPGIPQARRAAVFEPFHRLGDRSTRAGVGLGLAIAQGFTEATGGSLHLADTPGGGVTASFHLPVAGDAAGPATGSEP